MKNRAFTLIELLAAIVILAIILAIAIPGISSIINSVRSSAYLSNERLLVNATKTYIGVDESKLPVNIGDISIVKLSDLQTNKYITTIKDATDSSIECSGYVTIKKTDTSKYDYNPYLKCGSNYETSGYVSSGLTSVEVLVVAGGGSGGTSAYTNGGGGGGGAGGLIYNTTYSVASGIGYTVKVGNGGAAKTSTYQRGDNGQNSIFGDLVAIGGGGGGAATYGNGSAGGSGGGAGYAGYGYRTGPNGTVGQGNKGGDVLGNNCGAGGGGAGGVGGNTSDTGGVPGGSGGVGGLGLSISISGTTITYATGGAGAGGDRICGLSGAANTGNGGNGVYSNGCPSSGAGGSGIVIVRYPGGQKANGGTVTYVNGYTIHTFAITGDSTFNTLTF